MLEHPTYDKLIELRLRGMRAALLEQERTEDPAVRTRINQLDFKQRLGLLVDRELTERDNRRLASRLKNARLRQRASVEAIDFAHPRNLDRGVMDALAKGDWIERHRNVLITGPTGVGKSYLACALGHKACLLGFTVRYERLAPLLAQIRIAHGDGSYNRLKRALGKIDVLILDDWGLKKLTTEHQYELLEIIEDRYGRKATVITSQYPVTHWHEQTMSDPTLADSLLDRLVHNAYRIELTGESMRREYNRINTEKTQPENSH